MKIKKPALSAPGSKAPTSTVASPSGKGPGKRFSSFTRRRRTRAGDLAGAVRAVKKGQVVIFPTDTVYGLGAAYNNPKAIAKIFRLKGRPRNKPLPILVADQAQLKKIVSQISTKAKELIKKHWPGPLTLILPIRHKLSGLVSSKSPSVLLGVSASRAPAHRRPPAQPKLSPFISRQSSIANRPGQSAGRLVLFPHGQAAIRTVAVRQPDHPLTLKLLRKTGPLATTSANLSGSPAPARVQDIPQKLRNSADFVLDAGPCPVGQASTILDLSVYPPAVLRPGPLSGLSGAFKSC